MDTCKLNLKKFDLYPFTAIAVDSNGILIYKNKYSKMVFPALRVGAKLSSYSDADTSKTGIQHITFYGEESTALIHKLENHEIDSIITIFSPSCANVFDEESTSDEYKNIINNLLNCNKSESHKIKNALINHISLNFETARACSKFSSLYLNKLDFGKEECVSASSFFESLSNIMENRLCLGVKINVEEPVLDVSVIIDKKSAAMLLNTICFALSISDDKSVSVSFKALESEVEICIRAKSAHNLEKMYDKESEFPYIFSLLIGTTLSQRLDCGYLLEKDKYSISFKMTLPSNASGQASFSSSGVTEDFINEYFSLLSDLFKTDSE